MKITKAQLKKLIAEEIDEIKLAVDTRGQGKRYGHIPNITGPSPQYAGYEEEEESPCAMAAAEEEPPDLESRVANIEQKLDMILSQMQMVAEDKKDPDAEVRNRGDATFSAGSKKVKDDKDHFPVNSKDQARNALARASQYDKKPKWYTGDLDSLVKAVQRKVKAKYPDIATTKKSSTPGKG